MGRSRTKTRLLKAIQKQNAVKRPSLASSRKIHPDVPSETEEVLEQGGPLFQTEKDLIAIKPSGKSNNGTQNSKADQMDNGSAREVNYVDTTESVDEGSDDDSWKINQLLIGDGSKLASGRLLRKGQLYACGSAHGSLETFHRVEEESLGLHYNNEELVPVQGKFLTEATRKKHGSHSIFAVMDTMTLRRDGSSGFTDECLRYLRLHPGFSMRLNFPGHRPTSTEAEKFSMRHLGPIYAYGENRNCLIAASINLVHCAWQWKTGSAIEGEKAASQALECFKSHKMPLYTVASVTPVFHRMKLSLDVRKVSRRYYDVRNLFAMSEDIFLLVRLLGKRADHVVAVDLARKCVLDNYEKFPLRLCAGGFSIASGGREMKAKVIEVRQVFFTK